MTVVVEESQTAAVIPKPSSNSLAPWHLRLFALAVDVLPGLVVVSTMALVVLTVPLRSAWWWLCMTVGAAVILSMLVNRLLLPTIIGWSLGRALCGIAVVMCDGADIGPWRLLLRDLAHLLDTATVLVGWLWPLWDSRRRTFADILLRTEVRCVQAVEQQRTIRWWVSVTLLTAAGVCLGGAVVSCAVVYSHDRAVDQTRAQIAIQGPKMVAQMLTYDPKSLRDDFAHAQSLASDKYRHQLAAQQDVVEKGHPVINEYWSTAGAIQSATPDRATMLLFMQGRRGAAPGERYISATVRVSFAKDEHNHWLVDDLTVLTKLRTPGNGK
ncbi:RDD family protein [Mycobacterium lepromatosis]|uniref:MCE associated transmembrane protein n=1 Tax=Mycobacterium lepromatosis TaxID=480418 RepID=A0A0F4ESF3_9MYCO|nr:RDD family protein [Mycobacterium lepromatosis]KJX74540.1 MCE associated transmembrane protein [Mycobacterium lepromatosis]UKN42927.1 RDD family protein [Mycobacterium lepromatosis]